MRDEEKVAGFMTDLKTDSKLLDALRDSTQQKLTPDQIRKQKISFVVGSLDDKSKMTRADVEKLLEDAV